MTRTVSIRISQSDRDWLIDHRDSKRKGIADVLHEIIVKCTANKK